MAAGRTRSECCTIGMYRGCHTRRGHLQAVWPEVHGGTKDFFIIPGFQATITATEDKGGQNVHTTFCFV